ncbi:amidohydrolase family protein [Mycobacterium sp. 21AC1]|uniref:metal-dependent hydrolase family protein n=1 Tax=[Mycobacterium] appelbergii TaxID=2939269 RepID=UPI002939427C|nr:amidohydrolase family protein [Mycobacterium sp. 21AC1]MDV3125973.1 amidohydrolase family protein [Mycobacterium sp. 21AC1]
MSPTDVAEGHRLLLAGGSVFDGTGAPAERADVLVVDGGIVGLGSGFDAEEVLDVSGQTVLPGLIDCHVHVMMTGIDMWVWQQAPFSLMFYEAARNLRRTLDAGITTVRDAAGADYGVKRALEAGLIPGPRLLISIAMLSQTGGHGDGHLLSGCDIPPFHAHPGAPGGLVDGPDQVRLKVRELVRARADWIKIATTGGVLSEDDLHCTQLRDDELAEVAAEAAAARVDVMAHAHAAAGIKAAIRHGARSIEHAVYLDDEAIDLMLSHGTWLVPTLIAPVAVVEQAEGGATLSADTLRKAREVADVHATALRRAYDAGVRIAMGTDMGVGVHGENLRELELMHHAGMSVCHVAHAATGSAAELLRLDDQIGYAKEGLVADLTVIDGDLDDLAGVGDRVTAVIQAGRIVHRPALSTRNQGLPDMS